MSTNDVPGANPKNNDVLAMGCWAEHSDGSLIFVESVEATRVVYSMFDMVTPPVEYRDAMDEATFKRQFTWLPEAGKALDIKPKPKAGATAEALPAPNLKWTWHDKTAFPWDKVMGEFKPTPKPANVEATMTAAARVATSLGLRAEAIRDAEYRKPTLQKAATTIMTGIREAVQALKP